MSLHRAYIMIMKNRQFKRLGKLQPMIFSCSDNLRTLIDI